MRPPKGAEKFMSPFRSLRKYIELHKESCPDVVFARNLTEARKIVRGQS